jgi:hypothetical protein
MPLLPQNTQYDTGDGIPSLSEQTVNIAQGLITAITDLDLNVYIGDDRDIFFGTDTDFALGVSPSQQSLELKEGLTGSTVFSVFNDGTLNLQLLDYDQSDTWLGNVGITEDGLFVKIDE